MSVPIEEVHREIDRRWSKHLGETRKMLRQPSVSMTGEGIQEMADMVEAMLLDLGAKPKQSRGTKKSHPLVTGYLDVGAESTGIMYGMYDVQPVGDLDAWDHPPFGATVVKRKPYGDVVVNRGAYNSKGALAGMLLAVRTMADMGEMPMNMHFLIEGEEEVGGLSLPKYVLKNKARLSKADSAWGFDYSENADGTLVLALGMKGCVYFDLEARGNPEGGPMDGEIHSSDAVLVQSPVWRLVHALSTLVDEDQDPAVDGIWDDVAEPTEDDLALMKELVKTFDPKTYMREMAVRKLKVQGSNEDILRKYLFEPSLNIDGLVAGYTEEGTKTVLPHYAKAKIDIRLVPDMTIEGTRRKVMDHLRRRGFTDITMHNYIDYPWSKVPPHEPVVRASIEAARYHGKEPEVWPLMAGSAPFYLFDQVLKVPYGGGGLGHGGGAHSPNEFAVVKGMKDFEKSVATVLMKYAEMRGRRNA
jgi:acetylornithine deacetylase/succinyl-diaminopimelate desuccinylase-like protein